MRTMEGECDVLIVGGGLAGLAVALNLPAQWRIVVLGKSTLDVAASNKAQGGIAAVMDPGDHTDKHIRDTLIAGAGLCDATAVAHIIQAAPQAIDWLRRYPIDFTMTEAAQLHLTREGGHSHRRIVHAADKTGHAITSVLQAQLRARPNVAIHEHVLCVDALLAQDADGRPVCQGMRAIDAKSGQAHVFLAGSTVLATGGLGQLFPCTTNPTGATGDGVAIAWRAGCRISNLEFIQFHPTALCLPNAPSFLISEAVRGEGGLLLNQAGHRFMPDYDARAELAPRDIVARAIHAEMHKQNGLPVWLDISHRGADFIETHFPMIRQTCQEHGLDMTRAPIPVAPAAHYACGGVKTDLGGRTDVAGLYAVGEVADTGLHGANRLASNSLLECVVVGRNCAREIRDFRRTVPTHGAIAGMNGSKSVERVEPVARAPLPTLEDIRRLMGRHLGILRSAPAIHEALAGLRSWRRQLAPVAANPETPALLALRNQLDCAWLIAACANQRQESRGLHALVEYPETLPDAHDSTVPPDYAMWRGQAIRSSRGNGLAA